MTNKKTEFETSTESPLKKLFGQNSLILSKEFLARRSIFWLHLLLAFSIYGLAFFSKQNGGLRFPQTGDFWNHIHLIQSFLESLQSGQWLPRTVVTQIPFYDFTVATFDSPTFQFYGFLESLLTLPLVMLKMDVLTATIWMVILARALASFWIHRALFLLGLSNRSAFLASLAYLCSPYVISCFYGRGALAEVTAHSVLAAVPLGLAYLEKQQWKKAFLTMALTMAGLVLSHNIFALYGSAFIAIWALTRNLVRFSFPYLFVLGSASVSGLLLTAWQWLPIAQHSKKLSVFGSLQSWKIGANSEMHSSSMHGLWTFFPQPFWPKGLVDPTPLFLTLGVWTLPALAASFFGICGFLFFYKANWSVQSTIKDAWGYWLGLLVSGVFFFALTFYPMNAYVFQNWLPGVFSSVQDTYRLLSFASLSIAMILGFAFFVWEAKFKSPTLKNGFFVLVFAMIPVSQASVFKRHFTDFEHGRHLDLDGFVRAAPINAYYFAPTFGPTIRNGGGLLLNNNFFVTPETDGDFELVLRGVSTWTGNPSVRKFHFRIVGRQTDPSKSSISNPPSTPLTDWLEAPVGPFDLRVKVAEKSVGSSQFFSVEIQEPEAAFAITQELHFRRGPYRFLAEDFKRDVVSGYERKFSLLQTPAPNTVGREHRMELPIACGPLWKFSQNGSELQSDCDYNYRAVVWTHDIESPIHATYRWSILSWVLSLLGLCPLLWLTIASLRPRFSKVPS